MFLCQDYIRGAQHHVYHVHSIVDAVRVFSNEHGFLPGVQNVEGRPGRWTVHYR